MMSDLALFRPTSATVSTSTKTSMSYQESSMSYNGSSMSYQEYHHKSTYVEVHMSHWNDIWSVPCQYYDADGSERESVLEWFKMVRTPFDDEGRAMRRLLEEAKNFPEKPNTYMIFLQKAKDADKSVSGLMRAECLVVTMYTGDSSDRAFYKKYNKASREQNWSPYRVYSTLLMSAMRKLAMNDPLPQDTKLYRGIKTSLDLSTTERLYWASITSTSTDMKVADDFAGPEGTILVFSAPPSVYAAQVGTLSFHDEDEVLLSPFVAFVYQGAKGKFLNFRVSARQKFLK